MAKAKAKTENTATETASANETARDRFLRLAPARTDAALKKLAIVSNLTRTWLSSAAAARARTQLSGGAARGG